MDQFVRFRFYFSECDGYFTANLSKALSDRLLNGSSDNLSSESREFQIIDIIRDIRNLGGFDDEEMAINVYGITDGSFPKLSGFNTELKINCICYEESNDGNGGEVRVYFDNFHNMVFGDFEGNKSQPHIVVRKFPTKLDKSVMDQLLSYMDKIDQCLSQES